jgi:NRAMP (natural resistance-associated macrophage protein)-like metal ion transporter
VQLKPEPPAERREEPRPEREYERGPGGRVRAFLRNLGPGLITGAADDDPSGIATYSQAGAAFGYGLLWTALISLPLMAAVQLMCARIGIVADSGLARVLRRHYPRSLLWATCTLLLIGNTINIAADLGGMAEAAEMLTGVPSVVLVPLITAIILALLVFANYALMTSIFKWMTLVLFAYVAAAFFAHPSWPAVLRGTFVPEITFTSNYLLTFVAILGTTISPYLFFWQSSQNAEQEDHLLHQLNGRPRRAIQRELRGARGDVVTGMLISNLIMFFIVLTAGATLHAAGRFDIQTAQQAADALRPIAGPSAALLFTVGIVGTGMLGVPVLAGSAAYAIAEASAWRRGMDETARSARQFYTVLALAMVGGMVITFAHLDPIKLLFWSAVVNGLLAPPLIVIILIVCNNEKVMGAHRNGRLLNVLGVAAALVMGLAALALIASWVGLL